jgi:hypothetical protein
VAVRSKLDAPSPGPPATRFPDRRLSSATHLPPHTLTALSSIWCTMSKAQEAQQFLDNLESWAPASATPPPAGKPGKATGAPAKPGAPGAPAEAADAIAFLDEITQKSAEPPRPGSALLERPLSRAGTPASLRKSTERVRVGAPAGSGSPRLAASASLGSLRPGTLSRTASASTPAAPEPPEPEPAKPAAGGWGWGSVLAGASAALQQARAVVDDQVKQLPNNEQAMNLAGGVLGYARTAQERAQGIAQGAAQSAQEYAKSAQEYAKTAQLDKLSEWAHRARGSNCLPTPRRRLAEGRTNDIDGHPKRGRASHL